MENDSDLRDRISTPLTFFLIGAGIGAIVALLLAPKSGADLRTDIADATRKGIGRSREAYYEATRERAAELYDTATAEARDLSGDPTKNPKL